MRGNLFPTTRRSVVVALASEDAALRTRAFDALVAIYWKPLYKYTRFVQRRSVEDAEDLTQSFLAKAFEKNALATYDAGKARFRSFLRTLFDRHIANEIKVAARQKRGGGQLHLDFAAAEEEITRDPDPDSSPDVYFEREWVRSIFTLALDRLRDSSTANDFHLFESYDVDNASLSYRGLGAKAGMTETTVTNRLAAMRRRFREILLDVVRDATATDDEYRREVRALLGVEP